MKKNPKIRINGMAFYFIVISAILLISTFYSNFSGNNQKLYFSEVLQQIETKNVETIDIIGNTIELKLKKPLDGQKVNTVKKTISPYWMGELIRDLKEASKDGSFKYDYTEPMNVGGWINGLMIFLMIASMGFFFYFVYFRQMGDGKNPMNFGKSRAKRFDPSQNKVTFADVAGVDEEKEELEEVVDFLKNPKKYSDLGARIPRGVLLVGPPGTGKTLLAKAVAGEAGVPFYSISGSDFVELYVGVGASRVRDMFEEVKMNSPAIIFIDEIDAVGRHRGAGMGGGHDEREQTLNQLLVEMDGFGPNQEAIIMAATNRPDILDPALLRPGRFDRQITVSRPDIKGREAILNVHRQGKPLDPTIDMKEIARITPGFTGADLANLLNEAALLCARKNETVIKYEDISEAVFKVMLGPEKQSRVMSEHEKNVTAFHEAGHAIVLRTVSETDRVERVSIIPAGGAGGYTAHKPYEDRYYYTKKMLLAEIMVSLGGRAAEDILYGELTTGASSDLQHINSIARDMICKYGMSENLTNLVFGGDNGEVFLGKDYGHVKNYSDEIAGKIDNEIKDMIAKAYADVKQILTDKMEALQAVGKALLEVEKIDGDEFEALYLDNTTAVQRQNDAVNKAVKEVTERVLAARLTSNTEVENQSESPVFDAEEQE